MKVGKSVVCLKNTEKASFLDSIEWGGGDNSGHLCGQGGRSGRGISAFIQVQGEAVERCSVEHEMDEFYFWKVFLASVQEAAAVAGLWAGPRKQRRRGECGMEGG